MSSSSRSIEVRVRPHVVKTKDAKRRTFFVLNQTSIHTHIYLYIPKKSSLSISYLELRNQ